MGLDAVVYKNIRHLKLGSDIGAAKLNPDTGEVYFEDDEVSRRHREQLQAIDIRLGNITAIAELREEVTQLIGLDSLLYKKVLYSGSHSGDFIPINELPAIIEEIAKLRILGSPSTELTFLLTAMAELVRVAGAEGNPIFFA